MSVINIIVGILLWIGIYTIIARVCECFERCNYYQLLQNDKKVTVDDLYPSNYYQLLQNDKKVTVEDLYPKENQND